MFGRYRAVMRAECAQNAGCPNDAAQAEQADRDEPHQHHRPEDVTDERGSLALDWDRRVAVGEAVEPRGSHQHAGSVRCGPGSPSARWLHSLGLGQYAPAFAENAVQWVGSSSSEYSDQKDHRASLQAQIVTPSRTDPDRPLSGGPARRVRSRRSAVGRLPRFDSAPTNGRNRRRAVNGPTSAVRLLLRLFGHYKASTPASQIGGEATFVDFVPNG
jgi:hypothetical protein